jgi:hypothetical protein
MVTSRNDTAHGASSDADFAAAMSDMIPSAGMATVAITARSRQCC